MRVVVRSGSSERMSGTTWRTVDSNGDDVLTFLLEMDGETCVTFNNDMNTGLSISLCDRRSVDGREGEEEGRESRCDRVCAHFDGVFFSESDQRLPGSSIGSRSKDKGIEVV